MNCQDVQPRLALAAYGDLADSESAAVTAHLAACSACRAEAESLRRTRAALDAIPTPEVTVSTGEIVRAETAALTRRTRRWRRLTFAAAGLAAGLIAVLVARPDICVDDGALVVRWREPSPPPAATVVYIEPPSRDSERVELLVKLVRTLSEDAEGRDRDRQREIASLRGRIDRLSVQEDARWQDIQRDMGVLYRAQFAQREGGE